MKRHTMTLRFRHHLGLRFALCLTAATLLGASCTGGSHAEAAETLPFGDEPGQELSVEDSSSNGSTAEVQDVGLEGVEQLWRDAGASPELATCYREALEQAGSDTEIKTLDDVVAVQEALTEPQRANFDSCLNQEPGS